MLHYGTRPRGLLKNKWSNHFNAVPAEIDYEMSLAVFATPFKRFPLIMPNSHPVTLMFSPISPSLHRPQLSLAGEARFGSLMDFARHCQEFASW